MNADCSHRASAETRFDISTAGTAATAACIASLACVLEIGQLRDACISEFLRARAGAIAPGRALYSQCLAGDRIALGGLLGGEQRGLLLEPVLAGGREGKSVGLGVLVLSDLGLEVLACTRTGVEGWNRCRRADSGGGQWQR
jgi:hypothetical protein